MDEKISVIKVGGSILSISDDEMFSFDKANQVKAMIESLLSLEHKFVLVAGGGYMCRKYQELFIERNFSEYDVHYVGLSINNLNAVMLRAVFGLIAREKIIGLNDFEDEDVLNFEQPVIIAGAGFAWHSGDWDAAKLALRSKSKKVINMKDVDGVYSSDPKKDPSAKRFEKMTWDEYLNLIGNPDKHIAGGHYPVDPIAARFAKTNGIQFYIVGGTDLENVKNVIEGKDYVGTLIY